MSKVMNFYSTMYNIEKPLSENLKAFVVFSINLLFVLLFLFIFQGCAQKPKTIIKYKYIEKPCPKLETLQLNELNLNPDKELKFNFKVKNKN